MKKIFTLSILWFQLVVFAQQKSFSLKWEGSKYYATESYSYSLPNFEPQKNYIYTPLEGLHFVAEWTDSQFVKENSVKLYNIKYETISSSNIYGLDVSLIPNSLQFKLTNTRARSLDGVRLNVSPIVKTANGYKRLVSFDISYKYASKKNEGIANRRGVVNSVLKDGEWYRFTINNSGVYKLNKEFLKGIGINTDNINPAQIRIFGTGGHMFSYLNSENTILDPTELAIKVVGEEDGVFDNDDYIVFYGEGPDFYNQDSKTNRNVYTDVTYYYVNVNKEKGKRIQELVQPSKVADTIITTFKDYSFYEVDEYNLGNLGRRWFGDNFDVETTKVYDFNFPNLITSEPIKIETVVASIASSTTFFDIDANGESIGSLLLGPTSDKSAAQGAENTSFVNVNSDNVAVTLTYNKQGDPSAEGYLDYVSIEATRALKFVGQQFQFEHEKFSTPGGVVQCEISNASDVSEIWDITNIYNAKSLKNTSGSVLSIKSDNEVGTYVLVSPKDYYSPLEGKGGVVSNQNIKGSIFLDENGQFKDIDYLILTPQSHLGQANRLAEINRRENGLNVKVITENTIYKEFSTGNRDISAIRNFVKYVYDNASSLDKRLKYVCLFGDGSVDYKGRSKFSEFEFEFPSWYSVNSFSLGGSYVSDDFYGFMDSNEGTMGSGEKLDIAIGRIIANSTQQSKNVIDKIERYYSEKTYGSWRNNFVVISDDVDQAWEKDIQSTTDEIADEVTLKKPFINVTKIHADAYKQESSAGGDRYPEVTRAISSAIENGALVVNYFGHGGEDGLAKERIFEKPDANDLRNEYKMNCLVTVTCEYTRFDNPFRETAGELMFWNKDGGAVSLITTTRQVSVGIGTAINKKLGKYLFSYVDGDSYEDYEYPSIAEAMRLVKVEVSANSQNRFMFFIGDPAMKLSIPKPNVRLTKINDIPVGQKNDTLKALSYVKLAGEVTDVNGNVLNNYNGVLTSTIFDKSLERETLANDNTVISGQVYKMKFKTKGPVIYRGKASVKNGKFEFDFVVPKDISMPLGKGKLSFYSVIDDFSKDLTGADLNNLDIGGINEDAPEDNQGPLIDLFMNDESFVSGGITNESPTLLVKLEDENGINTASGIGHDIVALIDGDEVKPYVLNDYYSTEVDNYKKGELSYPFRNLKPGLHTLSLKAWDVYNNSSTAEIQFVVYDEDQSLVLENVLNYPNPFINYTEFWFNHNSSETLDISVQIFTISGKVIRTLNGQTANLGGSSTKSLSRDIVWDGRDDFGQKIGKGTYIYKLKVYSKETNKTAEKIEKIVIL